MAFFKSKKSQQEELAQAMARAQMDFVLGAPEHLSTLEAAFGVSGRETVTDHPRFIAWKESMTGVFSSLCDSFSFDAAKSAQAMAEMLQKNGVRLKAFLDSVFALEDFLRLRGKREETLIPRLRELASCVAAEYENRLIEDLGTLEKKIRLWRDIIDAMGDGYACYNASGKLYDCNRAYAEMHGYTREEVLAPDLRYWTLMEEEEARKARACYEEALSTGKPVRFEVRRRKKNGEHFFAQIVAQKLSREPEWGEERLVCTMADITSLKEAQMQELQKEYFWREMFDSVAEGIVVNNFRENQVFEVNPALCRLLGYGEEEIKSPGFSVQKITPEKVWQWEAQLLAKPLGLGESQSYYKPFLKKEGGLVHVKVSRQPLQSLPGHTVTTVTDVSEVVAEREYWQGILKNLPQGVASFDAATGVCMEANVAFCLMLGYDPKAIRGKPWMDLVDPQAVEKEKNLFAQAREKNEPVRSELMLIAQDGQKIPVSAYHVFSHDPRRGKDIFGFFTIDLTKLSALSQEKEKLAELESYWREIFNSAAQGIAIISLEGGLYDFNEAAASIRGYTREEARKLFSENMIETFIPPEHMDDVPALFEKLLTEGKVTMEMENLHKKGFPVPMLHFMKKLTRRPGWDTDRYMVSSVDISIVKEKEKEVRALLEAQRQAVATLGEAMTRMAQGDLTAEVQVELSGELGLLKEALQGLKAGMAHLARTIREASTTVEGTSTEIASGNVDLQKRVETGAASMEEGMAALEEFSQGIAETAKHAQQASGMGEGLLSTAKSGSSLVQEGLAAMQEVLSASEEVEAFATVIDKVADQTNFLALNAAIEAARAGHEGRGFGVVAYEVRALSQQSAARAAEIKKAIARSRLAVSRAHDIIRVWGESFSEMARFSQEVVHLLTEVASATEEESRSVEELNKSFETLRRMSEDNASLVDEMARQSEQLLSYAAILKEAVLAVRLEENKSLSPALAQGRQK